MEQKSLFHVMLAEGRASTSFFSLETKTRGWSAFADHDERRGFALNFHPHCPCPPAPLHCLPNNRGKPGREVGMVFRAIGVAAAAVMGLALAHGASAESAADF